MPVTAQQLRDQWPAPFAGVADAVLNPAIANAEAMIGAQVGDCRDLAVANLSAHYALMNAAALAGTGIASASAGSVSVAFESAAALAQAQGTTKFLAEYKRIVSANIVPFAVSGC